VIQRLESESPRLHQQLVRKWHEALKTADDFIADLATGSARQRLARLLLRLAGDGGHHQVLLPSREDVGALLGITTETASRTVASFRREGLMEDLDRQGRHFRIVAPALGAVADGAE
jgi:CRP-like cAMP-binding protein